MWTRNDNLLLRDRRLGVDGVSPAIDDWSKARADAEEQPGGIGAVEPTRGARVERGVPGALALIQVEVNRLAPASIAAPAASIGWQDGVPDGRRSAARWRS